MSGKYDVVKAASTGMTINIDLHYQGTDIPKQGKEPCEPSLMPLNQEIGMPNNQEYGEPPFYEQETEEVPPLDIEEEYMSHHSKKIKNKPIMVDTLEGSPCCAEDVDIFKNDLLLERIEEKLHITILAISPANKEHKVRSVPCYGDSLGCYAYDRTSNVFIIECVSYANLGKIPFALGVSVPSYGGKFLMPLSENLIHKYMSPDQRQRLRFFKEKFSDCQFRFIQCVPRE